jgi:hypothetical protein
MPVPSQGHYSFHSFPVVDWFSLYLTVRGYVMLCVTFVIVLSVHSLTSDSTYMRQQSLFLNKGNNKITELRTILQKESKNSYVYKQTKSVNIWNKWRLSLVKIHWKMKASVFTRINTKKWLKFKCDLDLWHLNLEISRLPDVCTKCGPSLDTYFIQSLEAYFEGHSWT